MRRGRLWRRTELHQHRQVSRGRRWRGSPRDSRRTAARREERSAAVQEFSGGYEQARARVRAIHLQLYGGEPRFSRKGRTSFLAGGQTDTARARGAWFIRISQAVIGAE